MLASSNMFSDIGTLISIIIALLSLIISFLVSINSQSKNDYIEIDNQYKDLLELGIKNPKLRDPQVAVNYKELKENDRETYYKYCSYAYMMWNFLETIYDFGSKKKNSSLGNIWEPVLIEENKLHYRWFLDNRRLFRKSFQDYVMNYLNALEIDEGTMKDFKYVYNCMVKEFPLEELKDKDQMLHLLIAGRYKLFVLRFKHRIQGDNGMIGYAIAYTNEENTMMFLDYLNVLASYQNCGYGGTFLKLLRKSLSKNGHGIVFEIEPSNNVDDIKSRRKRFYLRNGASQLEVNYKLPIKGGDSIDMELMCMPCEAIDYIDKKIIQDFVKEAISTIHSDYTHTSAVIDSYLSQIPSYSKLNNNQLRLIKGNYNDVDVIFNMYELNFTKDYQMSKQQLQNLLKDDKYRLYIAKDEVDTIVGYAFIYIVESHNFVFLDYLAVSKFSQNQGYGRMMIDMLQSMFKDIKYGMICETPFPNEGQMDYYEKFVIKTGGKFLDCRYFYPTTLEEKIPMRLTIYPKNGIKEIDKVFIQDALKESISYIHSDILNIEKINESNIKNVKSFINE